MKSKIVNIGFLLLIVLAGCSDFLDEFSQDEVRPSTVSDMEELLLGEGYLNGAEMLNGIMDIFTDDIQCNGVDGNNFRNYYDNMKWRFMWDKNMFADEGGGYDMSFWELPYQKILGCNIVLDYLDKVNGKEEMRESLRGEALVLRSWYYLLLVNMFGMPYNYEDPTKNLGVPLKLDMTVRDEPIARRSVADVYEQIERDLLEGNRLLTQYDHNPGYYRIGRTAAKAILSRMYLYKEEWDKALLYADSVLQERSGLRDLNSTMWNMTDRMERYGVYSSMDPVEVIWMRQGGAILLTTLSGMTSPFTPSTDLLSLYGPCDRVDINTKKITDLRGSMFFCWGKMNSKKDWIATDGFTGEYNGIRTAELYLNRAEVYIRKYMVEGNDSYRVKALDDLNRIRRYRFRTGTYSPVDITDAEELFKFYKEERRRELVGECQHRWCDLRRYGMPELTHVIFESADTKTEIKMPRNRYVLPIPEETLRLNSMLEQNK